MVGFISSSELGFAMENLIDIDNVTFRVGHVHNTSDNNDNDNLDQFCTKIIMCYLEHFLQSKMERNLLVS